MIEARVAGVPIPHSSIDFRSSLSSISRPALCIAARSEDSVCSGFGRLLLSVMEIARTANRSSSLHCGSSRLSRLSFCTARQPNSLIMEPFTVSCTSSHRALIVVDSLMQSFEKLSTIRSTIILYITISLRLSRSFIFVPVTSIAW